jgi:hypothetical protein
METHFAEHTQDSVKGNEQTKLKVTHPVVITGVHIFGEYPKPPLALLEVDPTNTKGDDKSKDTKKNDDTNNNFNVVNKNGAFQGACV